MQLDNAARLDQHEFHTVCSHRPQVASLGVERQAGLGMFRPLPVGQERLPDMVEPHLFAIAKIIDCRIVAAPLPHPVAEKEGKMSHRFVERRARWCGVGHGAMLPPLETSVSHRTQR